MKASHCIGIFKQCIIDYHRLDNVDQPLVNPYQEKGIDRMLYEKNWIDTVQWHYEDLIRDPEINPEEGMKLKRLIDTSNQKRTDMVEKIDDWFLDLLKDTRLLPGAGLNTESPAWVIDRLSILCLKIFHMEEQVNRKDVSDLHIKKHKEKLLVLNEQLTDLSESLDIFVDDLKSGRKRMKVYRQMKLYNDPETNPILYNKDKP